MPPAVHEHFKTCPDCPHIVEWTCGDGDNVYVTTDAPHIRFGQWMLGEDYPATPRGFQLAMVTDDGQWITYQAWMPQAVALRIRDDMLERWPLSRYPKGDL